MIPAMRDGRREDTERRRQRVATAVKNAAKNGAPISVSAVARQAGVDRSKRWELRHGKSQGSEPRRKSTNSNGRSRGWNSTTSN
ncbi:hypothetical protein RKE29_24625 [Streptomyces sp. B1866]|uniref:hypothetical protein n=1 Tax=Streptomyces sp. B1866 TaxID=3075431 RepID=UPI00288EDD59|nr:hypothetical protein [Streptomyces sp. B1866]MDT3399784.1 hypothetical protein [Streptomyces sp. B1866]